MTQLDQPNDSTNITKNERHLFSPPGLQVESKGKEDKKGRKKFNERLQANVTKLTGKGEWMIPMAVMIGQCFGV